MSKKTSKYLVVTLILVIIGVNFINISPQYQTTIRFFSFVLIAALVYFIMKEKKKEEPQD